MNQILRQLTEYGMQDEQDEGKTAQILVGVVRTIEHNYQLVIDGRIKLSEICRKIPRRLIPSLGINMDNEIYENGIREYRIFNGYRYYDKDNKVRQVDKISRDRIFILYNAISLNLIELVGYGLKNGRRR